MTETTEKPTVHEAWIDVMEDVQAIGKNERTEGGSKFNFRGVDTVVNAVGPVLREHGVSVVPAKVVAERSEFTSKQGTRMQEAFLTVTWRVTGPRGDSFEMETVGAASDASDKATSQAHSVAYRIAFLQGLCIPTDDPEPDMHHVDRSADDEAAKALGWQSAAQQLGVWTRVLESAQALPTEAHDAVVLPWAKEVGLAPDKLSVEMSEEWKAKIALASATDPGESPEAEPTSEAPASESEATVTPIDGWTPEKARGAWDDLKAKTAMLTNDQQDAMNTWLEEVGAVFPENVTKAIAAEWFAKLSDLLGSAASAPPPEEKTWKSKAEANRTFDSLLARQTNLPQDHSSVVGSWQVAQGITKAKITPAQAEDWLAEIIQAELAAEDPF